MRFLFILWLKFWGLFMFLWERNLRPGLGGACMHQQILRGSFSAASKPIFAAEYSFFRIFQDQEFSKKIFTLLRRFKLNILADFRKHSFEFLMQIPIQLCDISFLGRIRRLPHRFWWKTPKRPEPLVCSHENFTFPFSHQYFQIRSSNETV